MLYDLFLEVMVMKVKENLPEDWENAEISIRTVEKINHQRSGIHFDRPDKRCNPTVYMEEFYEKYQQGADLDELMDEIYFALEETEMQSFEAVSSELLINNDDNILFELVNTKSNESLLKERPHREFQDLSIIYYWIVSKDQHDIATVPVTNSICELIGMTEERLYKLAKENMKQMFPPIVKPMAQVMGELVSGIPGAQMDFSALEEECPLYVFSNDVRNLGAVVMLYPEVIHEVAEEIGEDLYLLPSSRHEIIGIPKGTKALEELVDMVSEVNTELLNIEEILSFQVYQYDRAAREVTMATNEPQRSFRQEKIKGNELEGKERSTR